MHFIKIENIIAQKYDKSHSDKWCDLSDEKKTEYYNKHCNVISFLPLCMYKI